MSIELLHDNKNENFTFNEIEYCNYCRRSFPISKMYDVETCYSCNEIEYCIFNFNEVLRYGYKSLSEFNSEYISNNLEIELKYNLKVLDCIKNKSNIIYKYNIINILGKNGLILSEITNELKYRIVNILNNSQNSRRSYEII